MEFSKSQIYSLISQRVEKLQTQWYPSEGRDNLLTSFNTPMHVQAERIHEIHRTINLLVSELNQSVDSSLIRNWEKHFTYMIYPKNNIFKRALLHFFNPIMINSLGMNVIGQAFMLSLLVEDDKNHFAFNEATEFMIHINSMLDKPYNSTTLKLFIKSIFSNYKDNYIELSTLHKDLNNTELTFYFVHRKRFDLVFEMNNVANPCSLYNSLNQKTIVTPNISDCFIFKYPETLESTLLLRSALFSMLFGNVDAYLFELKTEVNALPLGRTGLVIEELVDTYAVDADHNVSGFLINADLNHKALAMRLSEHFSFMHDHLICEPILLDVAKDLFDKKIFSRSLLLNKNHHELFDLPKLFKDSYKLYIDKRFLNVADFYEDMKIS